MKLKVKTLITWVLLIGLIVMTLYTFWDNSKDNKIAPGIEEQQIEVADDSYKTAQELQANLVSRVPKAADFTLKDLEGNEVTLSDLRGKAVFLNFWASWCPPCKAEMPDIEQLYQETKDTDLVILTINSGEGATVAKRFMVENNYTFMVLDDYKGEVSDLYKVMALPTSLFIDKNGSLIETHTGAMNIDTMREYVELILTQVAVGTSNRVYKSFLDIEP